MKYLLAPILQIPSHLSPFGRAQALRFYPSQFF